MATMIKIRDSVTTGSDDNLFELEFPSESMTVRELIRERVYQEVQDHNRAKGSRRMLVQPSAEEATRNGTKPPREVDWNVQFSLACEAFERRGFLVLVGEQQVTKLDEVVTLKRGVEVTFLKLVALVGG